MAGARWRQEVSEGSLPPTGKASLAPSRAGWEARKGKSTILRNRSGGRVREFRLEGTKERRGPGDVTGWRKRGGVRRFVWGKSLLY